MYYFYSSDGETEVEKINAVESLPCVCVACARVCRYRELETTLQ
jgi:hypothetical protein